MDRARVKLGDKVMIPAVVDKIEYTTFGDNYRVEPITTWFAADDIEALKQTESEEEVDDYCNNCPYISWDSDLIKGGDAEVNETKSPYMQPCPDGADLISRQAAIEAVRGELVCDGRHEQHDKTCRFIADVILPALPSADRPTGEWKDLEVCSVCGKQSYDFVDDIIMGLEYQPNFCPNCGAKMDKGGKK